MTTKCKLAGVLSVFVLVTFLFGAAPATAADATKFPLSFVEFHWVDRENATLEEAVEYCGWIRPIAAKHGALVEHTYLVEELVKGSEHDTMKPDVIFVFHAPDMETLEAIQSDPEYVANKANRDRIFDFSVNCLWRVAEAVH